MKKRVVLQSLLVSTAFLLTAATPAMATESSELLSNVEITEKYISENVQIYTVPKVEDTVGLQGDTQANIVAATTTETAPLVVNSRIYDTITVTVRPEVVRPVAKLISDDFGMRNHPILGISRMHNGVDYAPGSGTPILAVADGVVESVVKADNGGYGVHVIIKHENLGVSSLSGHMLIGSTKVEEGQEVKAGDVIGAVGSTGLSTGPHLHFEILKDFKTPIDPEKWFAEHQV